MLLAFKDVSKRFPSGTLALQHVSFEVARGEFLSLVGPSGCGKSTLLRMIAGLSEPTEGSITWSSRKPPIGFVFQDPALLPWETVEKNVRLPLELAGSPERFIRSRVEETLALVGLSSFRFSYPRELSGGMKMRVSLARALAPEPSLLLMDEPFAALDEFTRERLNDELRDLWSVKNLTIVFVTHSIYESVYLSSRVIVLSQRPGQVSADIPANEPEAREADFRLSPVYGGRCRAVRSVLNKGRAS